MAQWRRERVGGLVHLLRAGGAGAMCGVDRHELGSIIWDAHAVGSSICRGCSTVLRERADAAILLTEGPASEAQREAAKDVLDELTEALPEGVTRDLAVYARACVARGDLTSGHDAIVRWRDTMRAIGIVGDE